MLEHILSMREKLWYNSKQNDYSLIFSFSPEGKQKKEKLKFPLTKKKIEEKQEDHLFYFVFEAHLL